MNETKIAKARKRSGKTQEMVVRELYNHGVDVVKATYINWEKGKSEPKLTQAEALAKVFDIHPGYFFD